MSTQHRLTNLPLVVQDVILDKLDRVALASVSSTCRHLHRGARKFLFRKLTRYEKHRDLIEGIIRRDPTLIPYIRSFTSYDRSLLQWMFLQTIPSLRNLEIRWNFVGNDADLRFVESIPPKTNLEKLTFGLNSTIETSFLNCLNAFGHLKHLKLQNDTKSEHALQIILEQIHCPSLVFLEVERVTDWRIQWRESFEESFPNLRGLRLKVDWEDAVMYDHEGGYYNDEKLPPSNVMWETILTLQRRYIFFDIHYYESDSPFLDYAPSFAASHQMDPRPLIQWYVKSLMFFRAMEGCDYLFVNTKPPHFTDLKTILEAIVCIDFLGFKMQLSLKLPHGTTPLIAQLLPTNVFELSISPPSKGVLDSAVIPACIRSLPILEYLDVYINMSRHTFQPFNSCTTAKYSFRSPPANREIARAQFKISRSRDPIWDIQFWNIPRRSINIEHNCGTNMVEFEKEVEEWFQLSSSMKMLEIYFEPEEV